MCYRDPGAGGEWRYEAHLVLLKAPYSSPVTAQRRAGAGRLQRRGGVEVNVSNLSVVSVDRDLTEMRTSIISRDQVEQVWLARERLLARRPARALDRSRRANHAAQYQLSSAHRGAARRAVAWLEEVKVTLPGGPRVATTPGVPRQAFHRDSLSLAYRELRGRCAAAGAAHTRTGQKRARRVAAEVVATHGASLIVEESDFGVWARRSSGSLTAFSPGRLVGALRAEADAVSQRGGGTGLLQASTRTTTLYRHCLCGARVAKSLASHTHRCPTCGLQGDRDKVAAALAAFVTYTTPSDPSAARVDYESARRALPQIEGLQAALSESSAAPSRRHPQRRDGRAQASARRRRAARRSAGSGAPTTPEGLPTAPSRTQANHADASVLRAGLRPSPVYGQDFWRVLR